MTLTQRRISAVFLFVASVAITTASSLAQSQSPGSGLQISPTRQELSVAPGNEGDFKISLKNISGGDIIARVAVNDFESDNVTGEPRINPDTNARSAKSIHQFLSGFKDVELATDETKELTIGVNVPATATPGAYYGIIRYQAVPVAATTDDGQVSLTASIGTIVLLTIPGEITENMSIEKVRAERDGRTGGFFFISGPKRAQVSIRNNGNGFVQPFGKVSVTKSGKEVFSYEINNTNPRGTVLPSSSRTFTDVIENVGSFGKYTLTANLGYGSNGELVTATGTFWVLPWWLLLLIAVFVLAVITLIIVIKRRTGGSARTRRR